MSKDQGSDSMRMWGLLLRFFRLAAGISHDELAQYVGYSKSLVVGIERGTRMPSPLFITKADECVKADGWLIALAQHLSRQQFPTWLEESVEAEKRARALWSYDTHVLHSLLRTQDYTRAVLSARRPVMSEEEIEALVEGEAQRQELLTRQPACALSFIIEEAILRRPTGGHAVMKAQLDHLTALSDLRNITIQVLPTTHHTHAGSDGPMTLLQTTDYTWLAHLHTHDINHLINDPQHLSTLHDRYTTLTSHALTPADSTTLIHQLAQDQPPHGT
jgi:transcriptional regulator with XRE-family HTH domain